MRLYLALLFAAAALQAQSPARLFVVNKSDDSVSIVNAASRSVEHTVKVGAQPHEMAVAPNGAKAYVANTSSNTLSVIDLKTHATKTVSHPEFSFPHGIAFTPDSRHALVTSERTRKIFVIDAAADQVLRVVDTDQGGTHMVVVNKAGTWAYFANREANTVSFMNLQDYRIAANVAVGQGSEGIALSPDDKEIWVGDRTDSTISVIDVAQRKRVASIPSGPSPVRVTFTPDGKHALLPDRNNEVRVYDVAARKEVSRVSVGANPGGIIVSSDGKWAYVACQGSNDIKVIDTAKWAVAGSVAVGRGPDGVAFR